jgi:hypothetical protein
MSKLRQRAAKEATPDFVSRVLCLTLTAGKEGCKNAISHPSSRLAVASCFKYCESVVSNASPAIGIRVLMH